MDGFDSARARRAGLLLCALIALGFGVQQFPGTGSTAPTGSLATATAGTTGSPQTQTPAQALTAPAQTALDQILGPHHSLVTASATYTRATSRSGITYQGTKVAVLSRAAASGPGYSASTTDNGVSSTVTNSTDPGGGIQQLAVAVVVDSGLRPAPRLSVVRATVAAAMGLRPARGDRLTVVSAPFVAATGSTPGGAVVTGPGWSRFDPYLDTLLAVGVALVLLSVLLVDGLRSRRRRRS